jgi:predicted RNase H-like HicB family nuclease
VQRQLTAIIERDADRYVSLCPEHDIASQGATVEEARELFFETASPEEMGKRRLGP